MPKNPILSRETFFGRVRGTGLDDRNMQLRHLEWNVVQTELGYMVESRSQAFIGDKVTQVDLTDTTVNAVRIESDDTFQNDYGTGGPQMPFDYNA